MYLRTRSTRLLLGTGAILALLLTPVGTAQAGPADPLRFSAKFSQAAAFDTSKPLRDLAKNAPAGKLTSEEVRPDRGRDVADRGHAADAALQSSPARSAAPGSKVSPPLANFEGLSNQDNFSVFGGRVNPPDTNGDVGPNHYVEIINLVFGIYSKTGTLLLGPVDTGSLWAGFAIDECTEPSGDPIVLYDQFADRWILTQFTTRGLDYPDEPLNLFYNCVAISTSGDPTGTYYRYAFTTATTSPTTRSTASGATPIWSPRGSSASSTRPSTASASTASNATR